MPQMHIQRAIITAEEVAFMVVAVPHPIIADRTKAEQTIQFFQRRWSDLPIALVARDAMGSPAAYYGRGDLAVCLLTTPAPLAWSEVPIS
jgi:hypothetical protein